MRRFLVIAVIAVVPGIQTSASAAAPQIVMRPPTALAERPHAQWRSPVAELPTAGPLHAPAIDPIGQLLKRLRLATRP